MSETFGAMLRRLRLARTVTTTSTTVQGRTIRTVQRTAELSQLELGISSGLTGGAVWRLEHGEHLPKRETALALAEGLSLDPAETTRFLIAAGYWPWDLDAAVIDAVIEMVQGTVTERSNAPTQIRGRAG